MKRRSLLASVLGLCGIGKAVAGSKPLPGNEVIGIDPAFPGRDSYSCKGTIWHVDGEITEVRWTAVEDDDK